MAKVFPFKGWRYNSEIVGDLSSVIVPPYDVISIDEQSEYYNRSPHNYIRINLNNASGYDKYKLAANSLNMWIGSGILIEEDYPAIYILSQSFKSDGKMVNRIGCICSIELSELGTAIFPHEKTIEKHLDDRYDLMKSTSANTGQIFMCYRDQELVLEKIYSEIKEKDPKIDVELDDIHYKIWPIYDENIINSFISCLSEKSLVIADGHHRYKTALKYSNNHPAVIDAKKVMVTLVNSENPGMSILPTHRILSDISLDMNKIKKRISEYFFIEHHKGISTLLKSLNELKDEKGILGLFHRESDIGFLLKFNGWDTLRSRMNDKSKCSRELDTNILHSFLLKDIFNIDTNRQKDLEHLSYLRGNKPIIDMLDKQKNCDLVCFVNPPSLDDVFDIAESGETMPQKSTYFFPKVYSGLVTRIINI